MSVWDATTYKLTLAKQIYEQLPFLYKRILGKKCYPYLQPKGDIVPFDSTYSWDEIADICDWLDDDVDEDDIAKLNKLTRNVTYWAVGMEAVYSLIYAVHTGKFEVSGQYDYAVIQRRLDALLTVVCASSLVTPSAFVEKWNQSTPDIVEKARCFERFSEGWKYYARSFKAEDKKFVRMDQDRYFKDGNRLYHGGRIKDLIILVGSAEYRNKGLVFSRTHLNFLIGAALRISGLLDHTAREHAMKPLVQRSILKILGMTISDAGKARRRNCDKVVQAYHKARAYMQMNLFENQMADSLFTALQEFQKKNLQTVMDLSAYRECFLTVERCDWLELLHVYKWMPPPDFDPSYAFTELYEHHMSTRKSGLDSGASIEMRALWNRIIRERKLNIATAYNKIYSQWPASLKFTGGHPSSQAIDEWSPRNLFPYFTYGKDVSAQIKDKTTVHARMNDEVSDGGDKRNQNFLLWYLRNKNSIDTVVDGGSLERRSLCEDNYARVAYKGEAHKPASRLFFMAPPRQRILLGELEGNISRIAKHYPASLQGVASLLKGEELLRLFNVLEDVTHLSDEATCYVVTFDLAKFSPRFNPAVLKDLHKFWAEVFGYSPIKAMGAIGAEGIILHTTSGLQMSYENKGADLEGFRGRMMTLFHADLIAAACRYAQEKGYIIEKSVAKVFIDDGAVRIYAKGSGDQAKKNALGFLKCMQDIYEAAGQENHPNKTIVSTIGGELLAEQYINGIKQRCPIKAGMRLFPCYDNPCDSLTEEFDAMFATAQGSVKDGCDWIIAYRRLAEADFKAIYRWCRSKFRYLDDVKFALKFITPKSMGGFGFPSMPAFTSTAAYDMTAEGLGMLNSTARMFPTYSGAIKQIMDRPVVARTPLQILREPMRVRMVGPILVEGRLVKTVLEKLSAQRGPFAHHVLLARDEDVISHATAVAEALLSQDSISLPVLKRAWECTPLAYLESIVQKFRRSESVTYILTTQEITKIRIANGNDVKTLLSQFF